ncbi:hypothetical protein ACIGFK_13030 [Streptomyces sp. NPDC085524]|uniref:hypothetical protein n=1 Tax=Streptomyces sp. NPDC085524 TaxID=3365728 RepID=UPI0037D0114A
MSTTVGRLAVHLTADASEIKVGHSGPYSWVELGPVTLHTDGSSPEALRAMAAVLLDHAQHQERSVHLERAA